MRRVFLHQPPINLFRAHNPVHPAKQPAAQKTEDPVQNPHHTRHVLVLASTVLLLASLLVYTTAQAQPACTHYASPSGKGNGRSKGTPYRVAQFWNDASPGSVLCLQDGVYTTPLTPPGHLAGTEGQPITIRAENDGKVLIDAGHGNFAVWLSGTNGAANNWFVVEGINAKNGLEATVRVSGHHNIVRRVVAWDGTEGQSDSNIFRITGTHNLLEDCAGWGMNARKIIDGAQAGNTQGNTVRRCWAEWNDWPNGQSHPINTYQMGYNSQRQYYENIIGTTRVRGELSPGDHEGVMRGMYGGYDPPFDMQGTRLLGSLFYTTPGVQHMSDVLFTTDGVANLYVEDLAAVVDPERGDSIAPWWMGDCPSSGACTNNVCKNCLGVHAGHAGAASSSSGWAFPGLRQGHGLAQATGGQSAFTLLPGLCKRVVDGVKTQQPLWPWPMNARIKDARAASGAPVVDVTATVEAILGPIPASCKGTGGGPVPPADTTPPTIALTAPSQGALISGSSVAITAEASDNVAVTRVQFYVNGDPRGAEQCCDHITLHVDSTQVANGPLFITARAWDQAGLTSLSNKVDVFVFNGAKPPEPPQTAHPVMQCAGALKDAGLLEMRCTPEVAKRGER